jgi:hypothetical protein
MAIPELHAAFVDELLLDAQDIAGDYESEESEDTEGECLLSKQTPDGFPSGVLLAL